MVGPQDGGFGFDQSKKYSSVDNLEKVCVHARLDSTKIVWQRQRSSQAAIASTA